MGSCPRSDISSETAQEQDTALVECCSEQVRRGFWEKMKNPSLKGGVQPGWVAMSSQGSFLMFKSHNLLCVAPGATTQLLPLHGCSGEVGSLSKLPRRIPGISQRPEEKEDASCSGWGWQPKLLRAIPFHAKSELISLLEVNGHCNGMSDRWWAYIQPEDKYSSLDS